MTTTGKFAPILLAAATLLPVPEAIAVTLGRVRGAALIGRPINVTVPVSLEAGEAELCVQADVYQGETRMGGIAARLEPAAGGPQVRITSNGVLEEPTVTFYLRVGCGQQLTRRYVLLAEYPDETASAPLVAPRAPAQQVVPSPAPAASERARSRRPAGASAGEGGAGRAQASAPAPGAASPEGGAPPLRRESRLQPRGAPTAPGSVAATEPKLGAPSEASPGSRRAQREARAAQAAAQSRLRLEPLDLSIDYSPALRSSTLLQSQESAGPKRAEAAALWAALDTSPEDMLRQAQRVEAMEREVKSLRGLVQQNNTALAAASQQVEKARGERNSLTAMFIAIGLLAAAAIAAWLWSRRRAGTSASRWWQREDSGRDDDFMTPASHPAIHPAAAVSRPPARPSRDSRSAMLEAGVSSPPPLESRPSTPDSRPHNDFLPSQTASMRMVKAEELIDIQQQAEFFMSIGHTDQALSVLEAHVHDHVETSPVVWLDLLEMYHGLDRRDDYERVRGELSTQFNAHVPGFDEYRSESNGLVDYRRALSRIVSLWPSPRVLEIIEESIFRKPGTPGAEAFDLEAYRDLLLLYNIARILNDEEEAPPRGTPLAFDLDDGDAPDSTPPSGFSSTDIQPLSAIVGESSRMASLDSLPPYDIPPPARRADPGGIDLDIDLEALPPIDEPQLPDMNFDFDNLPPTTRR